MAKNTKQFDNAIFFQTIMSIDDLLEKTKQQGLAIPHEMVMLKALSFSGLLLNGYPYKINQHIETIKEKSTGVLANFVEIKSDDEHYEAPGIEVIIQGQKHECKIDDLRLVLHDRLNDFLKSDRAEETSGIMMTSEDVQEVSIPVESKPEKKPANQDIKETTTSVKEEVKTEPAPSPTSTNVEAENAESVKSEESDDDIFSDPSVTFNMDSASPEEDEDLDAFGAISSDDVEDINTTDNKLETTPTNVSEGRNENVAESTTAVSHDRFSEIENVEEGDSKETAEKPSSDKTDASVNVNGLYYDESLPNDKAEAKAINSFLYDEYKAVISQNGTQDILHIIVYPLGLHDTDLSTEIFAVIEKDGNLRAGYSKPDTGSNAVQLDYGDYNFMIRGFFKNGQFSSQVNLLNSNALNVSMETTLKKGERKVKTSTTYMRIQAGKGGTINIFPGNFDTNSPVTGLALSVMMIATDDGERTVLTPTAEGNFIIGNPNGNTLKLITYLEGDDVCYEVVE